MHTVGWLTERTRQRLWRTQFGGCGMSRRSSAAGLVCLDTCDIRSLKGVRKVWRITAWDAACPYRVAGLVPAVTAGATVACLREVLVPPDARTVWSVQRVLTEDELKGPFDETCQQLGNRHTRTKSRHAWANGFVERLHGTILPEHRRVQFRRLALLQRPSSAPRLPDARPASSGPVLGCYSPVSSPTALGRRKR